MNEARNCLTALPNNGVTMSLSEPMDIVLRDDARDGRYRVGEGHGAPCAPVR